MKMRKGQWTKVPPGQAHKSQMESANLSAVDQDSFIEGLERIDSTPLHSTALEEHLDVQEEGQLDQNRGQRGKIVPVEKQGAAAKRKGSGGGVEEERKKKSRTDTGGKGRAVPTRKQQLEEEEGKTADEKTSESEESDSDKAWRNRRKLPSSDEEDDEGSVWNPSPMTSKRLSVGRKSSSHKTKDAEAGCGGGGQKKKRAGRGGSQLEVVRDAVLDFCQQYGETVESAAVRESVRCFADNAEAQLEEQISSLKGLRSLKRENIKVGSLIQAKTRRLLNAKHELKRAEKQLCLLEKEKVELQQRLDDLRRGRAFLHDVRELTARYLHHRRNHPAEKETFGASSLPALLLETKLIQRPEHPAREVQAKKTAQK